MGVRYPAVLVPHVERMMKERQEAEQLVLQVMSTCTLCEGHCNPSRTENNLVSLFDIISFNKSNQQSQYFDTLHRAYWYKKGENVTLYLGNT